MDRVVKSQLDTESRPRLTDLFRTVNSNIREFQDYLAGPAADQLTYTDLTRRAVLAGTETGSDSLSQSIGCESDRGVVVIGPLVVAPVIPSRKLQKVLNPTPNPFLNFLKLHPLHPTRIGWQMSSSSHQRAKTVPSQRGDAGPSSCGVVISKLSPSSFISKEWCESLQML